MVTLPNYHIFSDLYKCIGVRAWVWFSIRQYCVSLTPYYSSLLLSSPDEPADVRDESERCRGGHGLRSACLHHGRLGRSTLRSDPQQPALEVTPPPGGQRSGIGGQGSGRGGRNQGVRNPTSNPPSNLTMNWCPFSNCYWPLSNIELIWLCMHTEEMQPSFLVSFR